MKKHDTDQHARFLETARALGCDEDEVAFDEKLRGIAKAKAGATEDDSQIRVKSDSKTNREPA